MKNKTNKEMLLLVGMTIFMIIFPTTFLIEINGGNFLQKILKQVYPFFNL